MTHEYFPFYEYGIENPHSLSSPCRRIGCEDFRVLIYVGTNSLFLVCGYRSQNGWDCKGTAGSFPSGFPIGADAPCEATLLFVPVLFFTFRAAEIVIFILCNERPCTTDLPAYNKKTLCRAGSKTGKSRNRRSDNIKQTRKNF